MKVGRISIKAGGYYDSEELTAGVAALREAMRDQEIAVIDGAVGSGKTTLFEVAKAYLAGQPGSYRVVELVPHPNLRVSTIARALLLGLGQPARRSVQDAVADLRVALRRFLDSGIFTGLFFDHCQNIPPSVWNYLRYFNELRFKGEEVGVAVVAAGDVNRRKLPLSIQMRAEFFRLGGLRLEERRDFVSFHASKVGLHLPQEKVAAASTRFDTPLALTRWLREELKEARRLRRPLSRTGHETRAKTTRREVVPV